MQKFQNNIQDQFGNEITLPTITVKNVVGGALSTLFSDDGVTPLGNPFVAQDLSEFFFYAANNRYDIFITGPVTDSSLDVLLFDPADGGVDASTARTGNFLFDADITGIDPETDSIKFNSVTPANITSCRIALTDIDNLSIADLTALSLVGSRMRVWDELDPTQLQEFVVLTVPALDVDHFEFTVDFIAGTASMPADDKRLRVQFELNAGVTAPIVLLDNEQIQFGTGIDVTIDWDGVDLEVEGAVANQIINFRDGFNLRMWDSLDTDYISIFHDGTDGWIGGLNSRWLRVEADYERLMIESGVLGLVEIAAAPVDTVSVGQFWVRNDVPNTPMFTDDLGTDFVLNAISGGLVGVNGAKGFGSANQAIASGSSFKSVALNSEAYDTDTIHDNVTNNSRLTVPTGITRVRLTGYVKWQPNGSSFRLMKIRKNGAAGTIDDDQAGFEPDMFTSAANDSVPDAGVLIDSGIIRAVATDYFELQVSQESGVSLNLLAGDYWFQMDLIE